MNAVHIKKNIAMLNQGIPHNNGAKNSIIYVLTVQYCMKSVTNALVYPRI